MFKITLPADRADTDMSAVAKSFGISIQQLHDDIATAQISNWFERGEADQDNKPHKIFASHELGVRVDTDEHGKVVSATAYEFKAFGGEDVTHRTPGMVAADDSATSNRARLEALLDEALDESFPASDPIAICIESPLPAAKSSGDRRDGRQF